MSQAREQFLRDGYHIHSEPVIPAELVQRAVEGMEMIRRGEYDTGNPPYESPWNPGDPDDVLCKIEMPILANKAIMELVSHPALAKLAAEVADADMLQVWWVQLLRKPSTPAGGSLNTNVGMHQDFFYWQNHWDDNSELFTAWVAVSDVTPEAGSMHFVKGSHKWGLGEDSDFFGQDIESQKATINARTGDEWIDVASSLRPGGVSFHHCLTYHGSGPNTSGAPRLGFAIHMRTNKSQTKNGRRDGLTEFIDNDIANPIVFGERMPESLPA